MRNLFLLKRRTGIISIGLVFLLLLFSTNIFAKKTKSDENNDTIKSGDVSGLKFRSIGPAYASGRIADFAVNPKNHSEWYVAVASGNIWKTTNNGQTFDPIFDKYGSYSSHRLKIHFLACSMIIRLVNISDLASLHTGMIYYE